MQGYLLKWVQGKILSILGVLPLLRENECIWVY